MSSIPPVGALLREWRQRRRLSQLGLAGEAGISTRHLSFIETGRSLPSREMVLHLAEQLEIPARERNALLVAAGYAPVFSELSLDAPALDSVRAAVALALERQKPYPGFAIDRYWRVVASNSALPRLYEGVAPELLKAPINALRLSLHPQGIAPRIVNLPEWRAHLLARLRHQIDLTADPGLIKLMREVSAYAGPAADAPDYAGRTDGIVAIPLQIVTPAGVLSFLSTTTVFATPVDITLSELALELLYPADAVTAEAVQRLTEEAAQGREHAVEVAG